MENTFDNFDKTMEQALAFQRIWLDTMTKTMQAAFTMAPTASPPEVMREMRSGVFQAMAQSWEEYMRMPQFLEGAKQWMENVITCRKMTNDFLAKVRNEMQAPSRDDIDSIMLTVRHMETRLLDRIDNLAAQVNELNQRLASSETGKASGGGATGPRKPAGKSWSDAGEVEVV